MLAIGSDRILFSADYPCESTKEVVAFIDSAPRSDIDREKICHINAERVLNMGKQTASTNSKVSTTAG